MFARVFFKATQDSDNTPIEVTTGDTGLLRQAPFIDLPISGELWRRSK